MKIKGLIRQENALARFMTVCAAFATLIVLTLVGCELAIRRGVPNPYKFKHQRLSQKSDDIATLILGNSHAYYGMRPEILGDSSFNLGNVSQLLRYDNELLRHYPFPNLKTVILPISYSSFTEHDFSETHDWTYAVNYKIYMDLNLHGDFSRYNLELSRPAIFSDKLRALVEGKGLSCDSLGFGLDMQPELKNADWEETGLETAARHTGKDLKAVPQNIHYLSEIARYCNERGVRLYVVLMPAWKTYRDDMKKSQYEMVVHIADSMAAADGFRFFNMIDDPRFGADDFFDSDHFVPSGADKFTRILRDSIKL